MTILGTAVNRLFYGTKEKRENKEDKERALHKYLLESNWTDATPEDMIAMMDELVRLEKKYGKLGY